MLDYHGNHVGLHEFVDVLGAAAFADPALTSAQQDALQAVSDEPGCALVGGFLHHLLSHATSDGSEIELLTQAAELWKTGVQLCNQLGTIRSELEAAMAEPGSPGAADRFNTAAVRAQELANEVIGLRAGVDAVRSKALDFRHLPAHPRQSDVATDAWDWSNLTTGRRTDALVRSLLARAVDPRTLAVAVGAAAAYGANAAGSAYLGAVVGGPRRSHRHRDRLARNAVGTRLRDQHPATRDPSAMADEVATDPNNTALAPDVEQLLRDAFQDAFDTSRTVPIPDLNTGYERLRSHLRLLDQFTLPAPPAPPSQFWMATLWSDPNSPPPMLRPQDVDIVGQDDGGVAVQMGLGEPGSGTSDSSDSSKASKGCGIAVLAIILIDLLQAFVQCIGQWANGNPCTFWDNMLLSKLWEQDEPDPRDPTNPGVSQQELTGIGVAPQAAQFVGVLFDAHSQAFEAMSRARAFLAITGLVYPTDVTALPVFGQFLKVFPEEEWPHREEADPVATFHVHPTSPIENPTRSPSPYPFGAGPEVIFSNGSELHAATISLTLWASAVAGTSGEENLDLDGDRGARHRCWAAEGSVHDDPVDVRILDYADQ